MSKWHEDARNRKKIGEDSEAVFSMTITCKCGGRFKYIGKYMGGPDFKCESCGQLVDVKSSPQAEQTGNISVSSVPFSHYTNSTLIAVMIKSTWLGEYKENIHPRNSTPNAPTHSSSDSSLKDTSWYLVSWRSFKTLESLGYSVSNAMSDSSA